MNTICRLFLLTVVLGGVSFTSFAQTPAQVGPQASGPSPQPAVALSSQVITQPGRPHLVLVTDPQAKVLAVYQIDPATGGLSLKSVRNISWDLKMLEFNSKKDLSPQEVRAGLAR